MTNLEKSHHDDNKSTTSNATSSVPDEETMQTPQLSSSVSNEAIYKLASNDVLMGRGAAVIGNEGNRRFRKLIQKFKSEYDATRIRQEKDRIARKIVESIISRGGRFLKKIDTPAQMEFYKVPTGKSAWAIVKENVVLQKVKQAFRDDRRSLEEGDSNHSPRQGGLTSPAMLKPALGGSFPKSVALGGAGTVDSLLGDSSLIGNPNFVNAALLMISSGAAYPSSLGGVGGFLPFQHQQLLRNQLDSQIMAQLVYARQQQQLDPLTELRNQVLLAEENHRVMLLRQALSRQQQDNDMPQLGALHRQAALREQLAMVGRTTSPPSATMVPRS